LLGKTWHCARLLGEVKTWISAALYKPRGVVIYAHPSPLHPPEDAGAAHCSRNHRVVPKAEIVLCSDRTTASRVGRR